MRTVNKPTATMTTKTIMQAREEKKNSGRKKEEAVERVRDRNEQCIKNFIASGACINYISAWFRVLVFAMNTITDAHHIK